MNCPICHKTLERDRYIARSPDYLACPTLVDILPKSNIHHYSIFPTMGRWESFILPPYKIFSAFETSNISEAVGKGWSNLGDQIIYADILECPRLETDTIISWAPLKEHELKEKIDILKAFS